MTLAPFAAPAPAAVKPWVLKIHFSFYFLDDKMPESVAKHIEAVRIANPTFEVLVWDPRTARELIATEYPQFLSKYDGFPYAIQRSDFSRYAILHKYGGIYADIDYEILVPFEVMLDFLDGESKNSTKTAFVNETPNRFLLRRLSNSFMIARQPASDFWMHLMRQVGKGKGLSSHQIIMTSTGPQAVDRAYRTYRGKDLTYLPAKRFNPCGICSRGKSCRADSIVFAYHDNAGSWNKPIGKLYNSAFCNIWWIIATVILILIIITLIVLCCSKKKASSRGFVYTV